MKIDHLSYSQINSYMQCPLRWSFRKEGIEPDKVSVNLVYGSAVHSCLEKLNTNKLHGIESEVDSLMVAYDQVWSEQKIPVDYGKNTSESLREMAVKTIEKYLEYMPDSEVVLIEQGVKFKVTNELPYIIGYIDLVEIRENKLYIVDFKTAKTIPNSSSTDPDQLLLYLIAFHRLGFLESMNMKFELEYRYLTKTKSPKIKSITVKPGKERAQRLINKIACVYKGMKAEIIYPKEGWWCKGCGYKGLCERWGVSENKMEAVEVW